MKAPALLATRAAARVLTIALVAATLLGLGRPWQHLVRAETADAHAFVEAGQRALTAGDRGAAVLAFERARALAPRSDFVRSALDAAGARDIEPFVARTSRLVTPREWLAIATASGWICALAIAFALARGSGAHRKRAVWSAALAGATCVVASAGVLLATTHPLAIVQGGEARMLIAPYPSGAVNATPPGGSIVIVEGDFGGFEKVETGDGATGWLKRPSLEGVTAPGT